MSPSPTAPIAAADAEAPPAVSFAEALRFW
jgi:hypothetical protein